ncbi:fimbrillin family protein [Bacteroides rodentium]
MNKLITFRNSVLAGMLCLVAASCSDDGDTDNRLPDGKYPMTFTASVDGLAVTRTTTENDWTGGEEVAIQIGDETKKYQAAAGGNLSIATGADPFYWQNTNDITVNAWYPYNGGTKPADDALRVKANQSKDTDYQASDCLEAVNASVAFNSPELTFTHRTAKVTVTLVNVESVSGAVVTFLNQNGVESDGNEVIPKTETERGVTTYTALLVPQQMQGKQFIKVALGGYDYFYIPEKTDDANLRKGKLHTYKITVAKTGLTVTSSSVSPWTEDKEEDVPGNAQTVMPDTDGNGSSWNGDTENITGTEK